MSSNDISVDDLLEQWNRLFPNYIKKLKELEILMGELAVLQDKLMIVRKELENKDINVDDL